MGVQVREAAIADADGLGRMHHTGWIEAYSPLFPAEFWDTFSAQGRIDMWAQILAHTPDSTRIRVAEENGQIVGFAGTGPGLDGDGDAYPAARTLELYSIYVLASHQGSGLAQRLLDSVLDPGTPAQLWVFENNPRARAFYSRNGFAPDGTRHIAGPELGHQPEIRLLR